jgi:hypothetical protein
MTEIKIMAGPSEPGQNFRGKPIPSLEERINDFIAEGYYDKDGWQHPFKVTDIKFSAVPGVLYALIMYKKEKTDGQD